MRIIAEAACATLVLVALMSGCSSHCNQATRADESAATHVQVECILSMEATQEELQRLGLDWTSTNETAMQKQEATQP